MANAQNSRWPTVLLVAIVLIIVGISGLIIFQWYLARLDANLPPLPTGEEYPALTPNHRTFLVPPAPSVEEKARVFGTDFQLIHKMAELPEAARNTMQFAMADTGEPWQVGCDVGDGSLPRQRLIFAGVSKDFAFIHYEFGGIGHGYRVEVYRVLPSGWQPYWDEFLPHAAKDMKELRKLVAMPENSCCVSYKAKANGRTTAR